MKKVEKKAKKKKRFSLKRWFKNINWTRLLALLLALVMIATFIFSLLAYFITE